MSRVSSPPSAGRSEPREAATRITSVTNPRVKWLVGLRRRSARERDDVTVVEGYDELRLALDVGMRPQSVYVCRDLMRADTWPLVEDVQALGAEVIELGREPFRKASYRDGPDGWLAVAPDPTRRIADVRLGKTPLVLVCEGIEKPGNLGAMLRTAEAAGVEAVIAASPVADWANPNVVRASRGTVFAVPVAAAPSDDVRRWLTDRGLTTVVATPDTDTLVADVDLTGPVAVVVGSEHDGVDRSWLSAGIPARLPMVGRVNSLNVATSAALVLYEALRQRG